MKRKAFLLLIALMAGAMMAQAKIVTGYASTKGESTGYITFVVESVDYRPDLTRVYGKLKGKPHTSERIDTLLLITPTGQQYKLTDIDGIDVNRWFQWEDDGLIEVEMDFPVIKETNSFILKSNGPKGTSQTKITKKK